ncbi:MAG: 3-hydroxyisobutyrate dehydrogenase [Burkholderiales bacterium]
MKIAFIGLGHMGDPMAQNLSKAGHQLVVYDVVQAAVDKFKALGHGVASSPKDAATQAELVVTMLPSSPHVKSVYLGDNGVLAGAKPGTLLIDSSTIDPQTAREVAAAAAKQNNPMIDAPVSGGTGGAVAGTLTFMVGGATDDFEKAKPVLAQMGKNIVHCGAAGNGQVAKICNNMLLGISMIGTAEAMNLGVSLGMDAKVLAGIINTSSGRCWSSDTYNPYPGVMENVPAARGYSGGFGGDLMLKDLGLAVDAARAARQPVILGAAAQQVYQMMSSHGDGGKDFSGVIGLYKKSK